MTPTATRLGPRLAAGRTAELYPWKDQWVLKLYRPGWGISDARHEAEVTRTAHEAGLPAPQVADVIEIDGRAGLLLEQVEGPSLLAELLHKPWTIFAAARLMAELHAALHGRSGLHFPSLRDRLDRRVRASNFPPEVEGAILRWLSALPDGDQICHGDFHPENILMTSRGPVIIDWVDATRGHPAADVARSLLLMRLGVPAGNLARLITTVFRSAFTSAYLHHYLVLRPDVRELVDQWTPVIASARWSEGIVAERPALESLIRSGLRTPRHSRR